MKKEIYSKPNSRFDENHPEGKPTQSRREGSKMRQICMGLMRGAALTQNMCRTIFTQFILPRAVTTFTLFEENWGPRKNLEKNRKQKLEKKFRKNQEKFRKNVEKKSETFWKNFGEHFGKVRNISNKIKKKNREKIRKNFGKKSEKFREQIGKISGVKVHPAQLHRALSARGKARERIWPNYKSESQTSEGR